MLDLIDFDEHLAFKYTFTY